MTIPPIFGGATSSFKYEELIDDWPDLAQFEAGKRGSALKNRHVGDAAMCKGLFDREPLRAENGVKYFKDTLRPHFIKEVKVCFLSEIQSFEQEEKTLRWSSGSASSPFSYSVYDLFGLTCCRCSIFLM